MKTYLRHVCLLSAICAGVAQSAILDRVSSTRCDTPGVTSTSPIGCSAFSNGSVASADVVSEAIDFGFLDLTTIAVADGRNGKSVAEGTIRFEDEFRIDAGAGSGFVELTASWEGDATETLPSYLQIAGVTSYIRPNTPGMFTILAPITFGRSYGISGVVSLRSEISTCAGAICSEFNDLQVIVDGIRVLDAAGAQMANFRFRTESTVDYGFVGGEFDPHTGVPEPASLLLLGSGMAAVGLFKRRNHWRRTLRFCSTPAPTDRSQEP